MTTARNIYSGLLSLSFGITGCISGDICMNQYDSYIYCSSGCCGSYKNNHCCSHTGLIVGIIVCVAVITGIVVIYCYLRHRNRKRTQANCMRPVPLGQPIAVVNYQRGPQTIAGPTMPAYPPPYDYSYNQPPIQPKGPPPAYDCVNRTSAGIGYTNNTTMYPPPVS